MDVITHLDNFGAGYFIVLIFSKTIIHLDQCWSLSAYLTWGHNHPYSPPDHND